MEKLIEEHQEKLKELESKVESYKESICQEINTDLQFLLRFLVVAKFDVAKAASRYKNYYKAVLNLPGITQVLENPDALEQVFKDMYQMHMHKTGCLYGLDSEKRIICYFTAKKMASVTRIENTDLAMILNMLLGFEVIYEFFGSECLENGLLMVNQYEGLTTLDVVRLFNPITVGKHFSALMSNCVPVKQKKMILVNMPTCMNAVLAATRPFMSKKLNDRIVKIYTENTKDDEKLKSIFGGEDYTPDCFGGKRTEWKDIEEDMPWEDIRLMYYKWFKICLPLKFQL